MKVISKNSLSFILGLSVAFLACGKGIKAQDFVEDTAAETTEEVTKENLSIGDFVEGILAEAPIIIDRGRQLIENLNAENLVNTVYGTLGELGLLDPQEEANRTATSPDSPYSNPESTTETDEMGRAADARQSQTIQRLSQIVFNKQGQEVVAEHRQRVPFQ
ncbi:hypothetical protein [Myxosarcina sp. GI1]|uniref:hypothetical protein n=1 Tax=Myxosarcina sp. GI1 TaxID=1541065 RepID=UPI00056A0635|nr:hypothetical protein [Myxosarcina sp. GI1]